MARIFMYDGKQLPDPDESMSIDDVRQSFAEYFPELYNASSSQQKDGENTVITFAKRVGTKGNSEIHECKICGQVGTDVIFWDKNGDEKAGYYCADAEACFERFREQRNAEPEENS